jgi:co-chaperonin GroES (HSP10)
MTIERLEDGSFIHDGKKYIYSSWNETIEKEIGVPIPTPSGPFVVLKIFNKYEEQNYEKLETGETKTESGFYIPKCMDEDEKYKNNVGKVLVIGAQCDRKYPWKIGSWVTFRRYEIVLSEINGHTIGRLFDDKILDAFDYPDQLSQIKFLGRY